MIDFRYHLVSLVSVFLALAVGIVLGAGPLKESIGDTLAGQVSSLRTQKDELRQELNTAQAGLSHRDEFTSALIPALVPGTLSGRSVVLISMPEADSGTVGPLGETLKKAGATVTGKLELTSRWTDPEGAERREALAELMVRIVPGLDPLADTSAGHLAALFARAVVAENFADSQKIDRPAKTLLSEFVEAGLVKGRISGRSTTAVLVAPPVPQPGKNGTGPTPVRGVEDWVTVARSLDKACTGTVILGPASSATEEGLVATVRAATDTQDLSTVDTGGSPMGTLGAVLALREQVTGAAGSYGFGEGARRPLPPLTEEDT
jgi:hypothetical protein